MKTSLVPIGNSKGIRIPKVLLEESGIDKDVEIKASKGMLKIIPIKLSTKKRASETMVLSEKVLLRDWDRPEEEWSMTTFKLHDRVELKEDLGRHRPALTKGCKGAIVSFPIGEKQAKQFCFVRFDGYTLGVVSVSYDKLDKIEKT